MTSLRMGSVALMLMAGLVACSEGGSSADGASAETLGRQQVCAADGMILMDFDGPKGQILWKNGDRDFYCEAREALPEWLDAVRRHRIETFFVQDFGGVPWGRYPDRWIDAEDAIFVIGSERMGAMGSSFVSFGSEEGARAFQAEHGGSVVRLSEITREIYAASQRSHLDRLMREAPTSAAKSP